MKTNHQSLNLGFRILVALLFFLSILASSSALRSGASAIKITPTQPMPLAGYYSTRLSTGVHDDLYAKALVLESGNDRAALVVCDLITMPRAVVVKARELIGKQTGIPGDRVMISATHTHTGPTLNTGSRRATVDSSGSDLVTSYTLDFLPGKIAEAVVAAEKQLAPARASAAVEKETGMAFNRRFHMRDGSVGWNPGKLNTNIVKAAGPIDPEVSILYLDAGRTNPLAAYVNFAMHPDTVGGLEFSADYAYTLSRLLREYRGPDFITLFANGTCGDINHVNVGWGDPQKGHAEAARLGTILAADVLKAFTHLQPVAVDKLRSRGDMVTLPLAPISDEDQARASNIVSRIGSTPAPKFLDQVFAFKVLDVAARRGEPHQVEVQVIALGDDIAFVSLPGEIFVELGLEIKRKSPFKHTFIAELANGAIGYIPTAHAFDEGNYEPISARCAKGAGEKLVETALQLLRELK
jgi:neutral ceramidase